MEITHSILSVCTDGALKTHVMFRCNLNSRQLHFYIESLLAKGLLEKERSPPSAKVQYLTTQRGRRYLEAYDILLQMLSEGGRMEKPAYARAADRE